MGLLLDELRQGWGLRTAPALVLGGVAISIALLPTWGRSLVPGGVRSPLTMGFKLGFGQNELAQWEAERATAKQGARAGQVLLRYAQPGESLMSGAIGAVGYYSDLYIYDVCGLVNREIAHHAFPDLLAKPPGHDKCGVLYDFLDHRPTYLAGFFGPADHLAQLAADRPRFVKRLKRMLDESQTSGERAAILEEYELIGWPSASEGEEAFFVIRHRGQGVRP